MYDELIKRLRDIALHDSRIESNYVGLTLLQAADAIEELQKAVYFHKYNSEFWEDKYNSLVDEKWIPVTERLPETGKKVLVFAYGHDILTARMTKLFENVYPVFECNGIFREMAKPGRITHWMPLPQPPESDGE